MPFCSWGGNKLTYDLDAGYKDPETGRFCLHPSFLEAEFTPPSQSADDGQVGLLHVVLVVLHQHAFPLCHGALLPDLSMRAEFSM